MDEGDKASVAEDPLLRMAKSERRRILKVICPDSIPHLTPKPQYDSSLVLLEDVSGPYSLGAGSPGSARGSGRPKACPGQERLLVQP